MRRTALFIYTLIVCIATVSAQTPNWSAKAAKAVFTLKTLATDGSLLGSSNGFFITEDGVALGPLSPFRGASRAVIIDAAGKEYAVEYMLGANEIYDVAKFRIANHKTTPLAITPNAEPNGATVWQLPYSTKKVPTCQQMSITKAETFQTSYTYYTLSARTEENTAGSPVLNKNGDVIGLIQPSTVANASASYAVSAPFAKALKINGLSINDATLKSTSIPKDLPDEADQALLTLYVAGSSLPASQQEALINRFIEKFPTQADGYIYRARLNTANAKFAEADRDIKQAIQLAEKKDDAHYNYALLILQQLDNYPDKPYSEWTLDKAMEEAQEAYRIQPLPAYRQQQAQILFAQKKYDEAYQLFIELADNGMRNAEIYYAASQCKLLQGDSTAMLALLDSAVNTFSKPYLKPAAPYLLVRAQARYEAGQYRKAVGDYNEYEKLMRTTLNDQFYYFREQAEVSGKLYKQALADIEKAIELSPATPLYYAEKASIEVRVGMTDEAIATAQQCIRIAPQQSDGYLFLGLAQCIKGKKSEGVANLTKAKELGNGQAQSLIDKYSR